MMFNCYLHGWSNRYEACPICHGRVIITSTGSGTPDEDLLKRCEYDDVKKCGNHFVVDVTIPFGHGRPVVNASDYGFQGLKGKCKHCGAKLMVDWKEVD